MELLLKDLDKPLIFSLKIAKFYQHKIYINFFNINAQYNNALLIYRMKLQVY